VPAGVRAPTAVDRADETTAPTAIIIGARAAQIKFDRMPKRSRADYFFSLIEARCRCTDSRARNRAALKRLAVRNWLFIEDAPPQGFPGHAKSLYPAIGINKNGEVRLASPGRPMTCGTRAKKINMNEQFSKDSKQKFSVHWARTAPSVSKTLTRRTAMLQANTFSKAFTGKSGVQRCVPHSP
jgi:hypothetical protein